MKQGSIFFTLLVLLGISLSGLITNTFELSGVKFYAELAVIVGLIILLLFSSFLLAHRINLGYAISLILSTILLLNLFAFYLKVEYSLFLFLSLICALGSFVISLAYLGEKKKIKPKRVAKRSVKFVAGKSSKYFYPSNHADLKRIKRSNRIYFSSEKEARATGRKLKK